MNIIHLIKAFRKKKMLKAAKNNLQVETSSQLDSSFSIRQDVPSSMKRLIIGKDCIVGGAIYL